MENQKSRKMIDRDVEVDISSPIAEASFWLKHAVIINVYNPSHVI